jgi:hypothetical protein
MEGICVSVKSCDKKKIIKKNIGLINTFKIFFFFGYKAKESKKKKKQENKKEERRNYSLE